MKKLKLDIQKFGGNYSVTASVISQDIANNRSTVRITATSSTTYDTWNEDWDGYIQGSYSGAASGNLSRQYVYLPYWSSYSVSWDITVPHNADGTCGQVNISCYHYITNNTNGWSSTSVTPSTIPRYTTVSTWSVKSKTETSITMSWKTADNVSAIRYGTSTSGYSTQSNLNKNSGEVTISGLTAGQTYTLYFMPQRKDSGLWGDGSSNTWKSLANQSTHPYPSCTSAPSFKIGQPVTLTFNNPRNRTFAIRMWSHVSQSFVSDSINISGTSYTFTPNRDYIPDTLYNSIPNNAESTYNIDCTTDGNKIVKTGGAYSVNDSDAPDFTDFNYVDSGGPTNTENVTTVDLTGDNQTIIPNYSLLIATIPAVSRATAKHGATMSKYKLSVGNEEREAAYSESTVNIRLDNAPSNVIKVFAIDSRNLSTPITKTASVVNYTNIQKGNINITRQGNVGEAVTLTFNGTFWNGDFGNQTNALTVRYRYKKTTESWPTPESWNGQTSIVPTTTQGSNDYSFSGGILGDTASGFDVQYSYNVEVQVSDKLSSTTFTFVLGTGTPTIAVADNGVAIKQPYNTNESAVLQVNGTIKGSNIDLRNNSSASIEWKEYGYGDKFRIIPAFSGTDDDNKLKIQGTVGTAGTDPTTWTDLMTISGKSGNVGVAKSIQIPKNSGAGYGLTNSSGSSIIRDFNNTNVTVDATGGGLYLGYANTTSLNLLNGKGSLNSSGVLNATGGLQVNGTNVVASGNNSNGYYVKYYDGTMICWGGKSGTTTYSDWWSFCNRSPEGTSAISQTLPANFKDTNYKVVASPSHGGTIFGCNISDKATSYFRVVCLKPKGCAGTSSVANTYGFEWVAIGKWK